MLGKHFLLVLSSLTALSSICLKAVSATPVITPAPTVLNLRGPKFTGVSISHVSIKPFTPASLSLNLPKPTCTQTIQPDKNGYVPPGTCGALYAYYPSFGAAIAASVLFGALAILHITQAAVYKKGFCWVIIMGAIWEFGSYASRTASTRNQQNLAILTVSQLLVLLAPLCRLSLLVIFRAIRSC